MALFFSPALAFTCTSLISFPNDYSIVSSVKFLNVSIDVGALNSRNSKKGVRDQSIPSCKIQNTLQD